MAIGAILLATMTSMAVWLVAIFGVDMSLGPALGVAFFAGQVSFVLFIVKALACRALRSDKRAKVRA